MHTLHFNSPYLSGLELESTGTPGTVRYSSLSPWASGLSGSFGTALALIGGDCGGVPDLLVGAPRPTGGGEGAVGRTTMEINPTLDEEWSGRFEFSQADPEETARLTLALLQDPNESAGTGEGYIQVGSSTNFTPTLLVPTACSPLPLNYVALPGSMPPWKVLVEDCIDDVAQKLPFYSPEGDDWGGFDYPRHYTVSKWRERAIGVANVDFASLASLPPSVSEATLDVSLNFIEDPLVGWNTTQSTAFLCPDVTFVAGGVDVSEAATIDGESPPVCDEDFEGWQFSRIGDLSCNDRWDAP